MKILKMELKRIYRNYMLQLSIVLIILIAFLGIILNNIYYASRNDSRFLLLSLYNSFTQFIYLVLAFVFVSVFCKDFQNGVYAWYKQLGYSFRKVVISKFLSLFIMVLPILNIVFFLVQIASKNKDVSFFIISIICANLNIFYIITLSFSLSVIFKKIITTTLMMYGIYVLCNGFNLWLYGIFNPADSNSVAAYYLGKMIDSSQFHYSLSKSNLPDAMLCVGSIAIPIIWSLVWVVVAVCIIKYRKGR